MKTAEFKAMWDAMHVDGYFEKSNNYPDIANPLQPRSDEPMDRALRALDYSGPSLHFPVPFSPELERSVVHTEPHWLPRMFDIPSSGLAIDIGSGYGRSESWLKDRFDAVVGIDISEHIVERAKAAFKGITNVSFLASTGDGLPQQIADESATFVYAFTVFQHIPRAQTEGYLRDAFRKLKPGGLLVFNLITDAHELVDEGPHGVDWTIGYSRDSATKLIADAGFALEKAVRWSADGAPACWLWIAARKPGKPAL